MMRYGNGLQIVLLGEARILARCCNTRHANCILVSSDSLRPAMLALL